YYPGPSRVFMKSVYICAVLACVLSHCTILQAKDKKVPLGTQVDHLTFTFKDIHYLPRTLNELAPSNVCVIVFTMTECPLVQRYWPRLKELAAEYKEQGVRFLALNESPDDSIKDVAYQSLAYGVDFPVGKDFDGRCAHALGATRTPEVVVLDTERTIRYRGRVNNQFRLGGAKPTSDREDLKEAIDDVLADRKVRVKETLAEGCAITFPPSRETSNPLTYARDVAPILNSHCVQCHRPGAEAPFALTSYEKAAAKAKTIAEAVEEQRMPPWFAHP